jgi:hypothetical protein
MAVQTTPTPAISGTYLLVRPIAHKVIHRNGALLKKYVADHRLTGDG